MKIFNFFKSHQRGTDNQKPEQNTVQEEAKPVEKKTENKDGQKPKKSDKMQIHNLVIVDESGSMSSLYEPTLLGVNKTIETIREAQKEYGDKLEHFLTLVTFDTRHNFPPVRTIINNLPIDKVKEFNNYSPHGCTPLFDAMGDSLTELYEKIKRDENATGVVTILTDGLENSSQKWEPDQLRKLIEKLKEEGWTFSYMGSAHNVKEVTDLLSIDNVLEFSHDMVGASNTWRRESSSRRYYFSRMAEEFNLEESLEEKKARRRKYNEEYYGNRVTPYNIQSLESNEIFVFGSNSQGLHNGGAAQQAMKYFGAEHGKGEGIQGQSYAIPTMDGTKKMKEAIHRFCIFAKENQDKKFLVTRIGCGTAGYKSKDVAPLFMEAIELENVSLPQEFWEILGLKLGF